MKSNFPGMCGYKVRIGTILMFDVSYRVQRFCKKHSILCDRPGMANIIKVSKVNSLLLCSCTVYCKSLKVKVSWFSWIDP